MGVLATVAGAIGSVASFAGSMMQANAASATAAYQAQIAANNAIIAKQNANYASAKGEAESTALGMKNRAQVGQIKAAQAASGVDPNTGSFAAASTGAEELGQLQTNTVRNDAARESWNYLTQSNNFTAQSQLDTAESDEISQYAPVGAFGSLLSSASSVASRYNNWQNASG